LSLFQPHSGQPGGFGCAFNGKGRRKPMAKFYLIGFLFLLAFDTLAQTGFKLTAIAAAPPAFDLAWFMRIAASPWVYLAISGYIGAFFTWISLLRRAPVGPAFAAAHLEVVTVMIVSFWVFGEKPDLPRLLGAALIIAGIIVLAFSERQQEEQAAARAAHRRG